MNPNLLLVRSTNAVPTAQDFTCPYGTPVIIDRVGKQIYYLDSVNVVTAVTAVVTIGAPVSGGGANRVLYEDSSQNLAADADFTFNGSQLSLAVQGSTGGLLVGGDALWYRSAADTWRTPDSVVIDAHTTTGGLRTDLDRTAATSRAWSASEFSMIADPSGVSEQDLFLPGSTANGQIVVFKKRTTDIGLDVFSTAMSGGTMDGTTYTLDYTRATNKPVRFYQWDSTGSTWHNLTPDGTQSFTPGCLHIHTGCSYVMGDGLQLHDSVASRPELQMDGDSVLVCH